MSNTLYTNIDQLYGFSTGDALLVLWEIEEDESDIRKAAIAKAVKCSREIQKKCHNWDTQVDVLLGVKIGMNCSNLTR